LIKIITALLIRIFFALAPVILVYVCV